MSEQPRKKETIVDGGTKSKLARARLNIKLLHACAVRDAVVARQALQEGANVNAKRPDHLTALHIAAEHGDVEIIRLLCDQPDIWIDAKTMHGLTPLHTSALLGHRAAVHELLRRRATANSIDNLGRYPLHYAALQMDVECARLLITFGARVNVYDVFSESPLHTSVLRRPCFPMARLLLANRASPNPAPKKHSLGLFLEAVLSARVASDYEAIKSLIWFGGNVNVKDPVAWRTPLHLVAMNGQYDLAEYLIRHGANSFAKNRAGQTPMEVAIACQNLKIAQLIQVHRNARKKDYNEILRFTEVR